VVRGRTVTWAKAQRVTAVNKRVPKTNEVAEKRAGHLIIDVILQEMWTTDKKMTAGAKMCGNSWGVTAQSQITRDRGIYLHFE
jgi:hypothetical protein